MKLRSPTTTRTRLSTRKRWLVGAAALTTALGATALWRPVAGTEATTLAASSDALQEQLLSVETIHPERRSITQRLGAAGSLAARDELIVGSDASVRWTQILVDVGTPVRKGQLLAHADDSILSAQLAQHEASLVQAKARAELTSANLQRAEDARSAGVYSLETLQSRRSDATAAQAQVQLVHAQIQELKARIAQTRVLAPADGVVAKRTVSVGAVTPAGGELFRVIRQGQIEWRAEVPNHEIKRIRVGAPARIELGDGISVDGRVRTIAPSVDLATRRGLIYVSLEPHAQLRPGGHGLGSIELSQSEALVLPQRVIQYVDGKPFVYVLDPSDTAVQTQVTLGERDGEMVEVLDLSEDTRIISTGAGFVKGGERVQVASVPARSLP